MKFLRFFLFFLIILSGCKEQELPIVTTGNISSITQTSALCKGYLISQGSCEVISKGICLNTTGEPTLYDRTITVDSSTTFTIKLTDLTLNTKYYVRAFATNCLGTSYGEIRSFSTDPPYIPKVRTFWDPITTTTSVYSGGDVFSDGAAEIIDRGICWTRSLNPDSSELAQNKITAGPGSGPFYITITGLTPNTDYFVRAYATNIAGTGYGDPLLATTKFESDPSLPVDPNYPTTLYKLDSVTLSEKRIAFAVKNKYLKSSLNDFGFCGNGNIQAEIPPAASKLTKEEAIEKAKLFCLHNPIETGVLNTDDLSLNASAFTTSANGLRFYWHLVFKSQIYITGEPVVDTRLYFTLTYDEVTSCVGNWYTDVYVPATLNFNQEEVKSLLVGRILDFIDISGYPYYSIITSDNLNSASIKLAFVPIENDQSIQLKVTWEVYVDSYLLYIDVMTGEIVRKICMIIS
jgi:hypothetical protein